MIAAGVTVGELVAERPSRSRVFEALGIDYCCGGKQALEVACGRRGVVVDEVVAQLAAEAQVPSADARDWREAPLGELADHIVATHHAYLRTELPRLAAMVHKVNHVHGANHAWLAEVEAVFGGLQAELTSHMAKEEQILFPFCAMLDRAPGTRAPFGTIANPIAMMEHEHDLAATALARLHELTSGYIPPEGACNTFRAMLSGLAELEYDLHVHIHKENSILFPRAIAAEAAGRN